MLFEESCKAPLSWTQIKKIWSGGNNHVSVKFYHKDTESQDGTPWREGHDGTAWPEGGSVNGHLYFSEVLFFSFLQNPLKHTKIWRPKDFEDGKQFTRLPAVVQPASRRLLQHLHVVRMLVYRFFILVFVGSCE